MIAANPVRCRPFMLVAVLEKALYVGAMITLFLQGQLQPEQAATVIVPDGTLGLLFIVSFFRTPDHRP